MKIYVPHYFPQFHCIASKCKDNCCYGGWEIDIDDETAEYYLSLKGEFGDRLRKSIGRTDEYCFKLEDGHCPFLDQHNLCQIYQNLGEDKMGVVCTQFPRYSEYYGSNKETGIGLACEEAERIIFTDREPFHLVELVCNEKEEIDDEFDSKLYHALYPLRNRLMKIIEDETIHFYDVLSIMIFIGDKIQQLINEEERDQTVYEKIQAFCDIKVDDFLLLIEKINKNTKKNFCKNEIQNSSINIQLCVDSFIAAYQNLEVLNEAWPNVIDKVMSQLHNDHLSEISYKEIIKEFWNYDHENEFQYRNLLKYFVFRYFMKSVYDHDIYSKLLMAVTNFFIIRDMDITKWILNKKIFTLQDRIDTVHVFSREVEYSEENLEDLKEEFLFEDIFHPEEMLLFLEYSKIIE